MCVTIQQNEKVNFSLVAPKFNIPRSCHGFNYSITNIIRSEKYVGIITVCLGTRDHPVHQLQSVDTESPVCYYIHITLTLSHILSVNTQLQSCHVII